MLAAAQNNAKAFPIIAQPGWGPKLRPFGTEEMRVCVSSSSVDGAYAIWECISQPGYSPPRHVHNREDEIIRVQGGVLLVWCDGEFSEARPGTTVALPRGVVHSYRVISETAAHLLVTAIPGGLERFHAAVSKMCIPNEIDQLNAMSTGYGIEFVGPSLEA